MDPEVQRRLADIALLERSREIMRDRRYRCGVRFKAWLISLAFLFRVHFHWHAPPRRWVRLHIHGRYCGPGVDGAGLPPVDDLDYACRVHDEQYTAAERGD